MAGAGNRVLVVDDDPMVRMLIVEALADAGFDILEAPCGKKACQLLDEPAQVSLVVTDINMPGTSGIAVAEWAREHHPEVAVLFVSGRPDLLIPLPFPYRYLAKPFSLNRLTSVVTELVNRT